MKKFIAHHAQVLVCETADELGRECAKEVVRIVNEAIAQHGRCTMALSGGSTPSLLYKELLSKDFVKKIDWSKVHFFVSDERCVPLEDKDSNFGKAQRELIEKLNLPEENIHAPINPEQSSPQEAAQQYEDAIKTFFELGENQQPQFDLLLLGMGPDGHCASLFPNTPALKEEQRIIVFNRVPNAALSPNRLTMTFPAINHARSIIFMVQGSEKSHVLSEVLSSEAVSYPVQRIFPEHGRCSWFVDRSAAEDFLKTEAGSR